MLPNLGKSAAAIVAAVALPSPAQSDGRSVSHRPTGTPYAVFSNWMRSPRHRASILSPGFRDLGIAVRRGSFSSYSQASAWVAEFGSR
jgi:uncharacterized protein YkwD